MPDDANMGELTRLADQVERTHGITLDVVSGGNSANLDWALTTDDVGRIDELRLGEAILLGTEPLHRTPIDGCTPTRSRLIAEVIEVARQAGAALGRPGQAAFGEYPVRTGDGHRAAGDPRPRAPGRRPRRPGRRPAGISVLGMSSDHLVLDVGDHAVAVGDELGFGLGYGALVRAMTSPFVTKVEREGRPAALALPDTIGGCAP